MLLDHFDVRWIGNLHSANKLLKALSKLDDGYALCKRIIDRGPVCYAVDSDVIKNALESHGTSNVMLFKMLLDHGSTTDYVFVDALWQLSHASLNPAGLALVEYIIESEPNR